EKDTTRTTLSSRQLPTSATSSRGHSNHSSANSKGKGVQAAKNTPKRPPATSQCELAKPKQSSFNEATTKDVKRNASTVERGHKVIRPGVQDPVTTALPMRVPIRKRAANASDLEKMGMVAPHAKEWREMGTHDRLEPEYVLPHAQMYRATTETTTQTGEGTRESPKQEKRQLKTANTMDSHRSRRDEEGGENLKGAKNYEKASEVMPKELPQMIHTAED
ncbi:unnamed protein product, partial [Mesorhabditis spiculigera]